MVSQPPHSWTWKTKGILELNARLDTVTAQSKPTFDQKLLELKARLDTVTAQSKPTLDQKLLLNTNQNFKK